MSIASFGEIAFGELPKQYDRSVANPFRALLEYPNPQLTHLIELYPYDDEKVSTLSGIPPFGCAAFGEYDIRYRGGITQVYLSDMGFITEPDDKPGNVYFAANVDNALQFDSSVLSGDDFGASTPSFGAIRIHNGNAAFDNFSKLRWAGRKVIIKAGAKNFRYANFATVFEGVAGSPEIDDENIVIPLRDNRARVEQPILLQTYKGTGSLEGGPDLEGKPKPLAYGVVSNIEPVLVDAANLIYQIHDGSIFQVLAVRDSGVPVTNEGNTADIVAADVSAGHYMTDLGKGLIKLGSTPLGRITVDAKGDNQSGFVSSVTDIIRKIVTEKLGSNSLYLTEINDGALNGLEAIVSGDAGVYITDSASGSSVIDDLIAPIGAYWTFTRRGRLTVGAIDEPTNATFEITPEMIETAGIDIIAAVEPAWKISVGYAPNWTVQEQEELAGGATEEAVSFAGQEFRYVVTEKRNIRAKYPNASDRVFLTRLANRADAEALLARLSRIYGQKRNVYKVKLTQGLYRVYIGDVVTLKYPRFSLDTGKTLLVVGVSEDAESGSTTIDLWG